MPKIVTRETKYWNVAKDPTSTEINANNARQDETPSA